MAPLSERDVVVVTGRVWRPRASRKAVAAAAAAAEMTAFAGALGAGTAAMEPAADHGTPATGGTPVTSGTPAIGGTRPLPYSQPAPGRLVARGQAPAHPAHPAHPSTDRPVQRPAVTVVTAGGANAGPPSVERALAGPAARRGDARAGRVTVVPGGHRPGKPDLPQRDRARAQLPVGGPARIVVLGCTVGAGQTMTTLLTGEVLASLRAGQVAVLDLNPGAGSLAKRAEARPALSQAAMLAPSRLVVVPPQQAAAADAGEQAGHAPGRPDPAQDIAAFAAAGDRYEFVLADPPTASVPRLLAAAGQLVLVAPASAAAPGAIAMTFEWLEAHGHGNLAAGAVMVLNGVSRRSIASVEQAERVCAGRCRAIVRIPWDDQLQIPPVQRTHPPAPGAQARQHWAGLLTPATAGAYTALAGVLAASLADRADPGRERQPAPLGQARR
jgi:MinD-like ATPase involved in chromosome partitioning or flagellar assembly